MENIVDVAFPMNGFSNVLHQCVNIGKPQGRAKHFPQFLPAPSKGKNCDIQIPVNIGLADGLHNIHAKTPGGPRHQNRFVPEILPVNGVI